MWFLPQWVGIRGSWPAPEAEPWRWLGVIPAVLGSMLMLTCVWRFGTTGEGTPLPLDPPRKFVAVGPYRYVRNPMYWGMALTLVGEAVLFALVARKRGSHGDLRGGAGGDHQRVRDLL